MLEWQEMVNAGRQDFTALPTYLDWHRAFSYYD
jgi:hypothetical protein